MSNLNDDQFDLPKTWGGEQPKYPHSKCQGPGPWGAGCTDEGLPKSYHAPGAFIGTRFNGEDTRICHNCAGQVKSQKFYDDNKSAYDFIAQNDTPITAHFKAPVEHEVGGEKFTIDEWQTKEHKRRPPS